MRKEEELRNMVTNTKNEKKRSDLEGRREETDEVKKRKSQTRGEIHKQNNVKSELNLKTKKFHTGNFPTSYLYRIQKCHCVCFTIHFNRDAFGGGLRAAV